MHHRHAPVERRGGESSHIGDHTATHTDNHVSPGEPPLGERTTEALDGRERLCRLTVRNGEDPMLETGVDRCGNPLLGDHRRSSRLQSGLRKVTGQLTGHAASHQHRIGPSLGKHYRDLNHDRPPAPSTVEPASASGRIKPASTNASSTASTTSATVSPSVSTTRLAARS